MVTGTQMNYVAGDGHRPLPMATDLLYRKAHAPQQSKPTGLDWEAITPRCTVCGEKSTQLNNYDTCPPCAGTVAPPAPKKVAPTRAPRAPQQATNVAEIVRLYVEEERTVSQIVEATGHARGTVRRVLGNAEGVTLRDDRSRNSGSAGRTNPMQTLKDRIADLDTTARDIKEWAIREGLLLEMQVGLPPARLVDAYAAVRRADGAA